MVRYKMGHLLNPVFRSIAPKSNRPKNLPVYGLNLGNAFRFKPISMVD
jgi:hypothetical protein